MEEKRKVLYVEDEAVAASFAKIITSGKYELDIARKGEDGIKKAMEKKYSILLVDINLGRGMTGIELCKVLRDTPQYSEGTIIAVTAYAMESEKQTILSSGFTDYLSKPYTKKEMLEILEKWIKNKPE